MKNLIYIMLIALIPTFAVAQERPTWAFPRLAVDEHRPEPQFDPDKIWNLPGSKLSLSRKQASNAFDVPNWFPEMYPTMPKVVQYGDEERGLRACAVCHLPTGTGHDESAYIAGLPVDYFIRQMQDYKNGNRVGSGGTMITIAGIITDEEIRQSAEYYAEVKPRRWIKVVETETVPKTYVANGN